LKAIRFPDRCESRRADEDSAEARLGGAKPYRGDLEIEYSRRVNYVQLLFPDFSLIFLGFLVCRYTALDRAVWEKVESLVYYFLFPVLLFHSIVKSPLNLLAASSFIGAGWALATVGIALAYALPHLPWFGRHIDKRQHAACAQIAFRFNSFIALALAERLAGPEGVALIAILIGVCVPVLNVAAVWPMARHAERHFGRELLRNPLILATAGGVVANLAGLSIPDWLVPTVSRLGAASLALGLMAAGAGLQVSALARSKTLGLSLLAIKHLLMPLAALALARGFGLAPVQATMLLAFAALPTSASAYVLATRMGYDGAPVAAMVTLSTVLGLLSLPFALSLQLM
jgi:malonate transporter and related proteins